MSKTKKQNSDPFAPVRNVLVDAVDAVAAGQAQVSEMTETEITKAKAAAAAHAEKARVAAQANVEALVSAGEIYAAGAEKAGVLVQKEFLRFAKTQAETFKAIVGATTPDAVIKVQSAFVEAEQANAKSFAENFAKLVGEVTNDAAKPVQAQLTENLKALQIKAA